MYSRNIGLSANLTQPHLYARDLQPLMGIGKRDKQGLVLIAPLIEVFLQVGLRAGIEIDNALLVTLSEDNALALVEINIFTVKFHQFTHTHPGRSQKVNHCQVAGIGANVTQVFQ